MTGALRLGTLAGLVAVFPLLAPAHAAMTGSEGRQLAASCSSCHGAPGGDNAIPSIAGLDKAHIVQAMLEFRAGTRQGPIMHIVASALSPDETAALAQYLSTQHDLPQQGRAEVPQ
jgi:cytochrome c553